MLRPASTRWFEVLCPRSESIRTVSELARTGAVEIEVRRGVAGEFPVQPLASGLAEYQRMLPRYERYWARGHLRRLLGRHHGRRHRNDDHHGTCTKHVRDLHA